MLFIIASAKAYVHEFLLLERTLCLVEGAEKEGEWQETHLPYSGLTSFI